MNTLQQWEKEWNKMTTKLNEIKRTIFPWSFPTNTPRKYESAINRLRIGHTHLTHSFLMKRKTPYMLTLWGTSHGQTRSY